jgi:hypothetical protein
VFPPAHPGVAYLLYGGSLRILGAGFPGDRATLALVLGAVLPDLLDQPLYHWLGSSTTRTAGHSLLLAVPVCLAVFAAVRRSALPEAVARAFAFGYGAHLAADAFWPLALGLYDELGYLLWPVTRMPAYEGTKPLFSVGEVTVTTLWVDVALLAAALALWWRDGRPGA